MGRLLAWLILVTVAACLIAGAVLLVNMAASCYHGGERYSNGARVDFSTGEQVCSAGDWVKP